MGTYVDFIQTAAPWDWTETRSVQFGVVALVHLGEQYSLLWVRCHGPSLEAMAETLHITFKVTRETMTDWLCDFV